MFDALRPASLSLEPSQSIIFLSPNDDDHFPQPPSVSQLSGTLTLNTHVARTTTIAVVLKRTGHSFDELSARWEKWDRVISCCVLYEDGLSLPPGQHSWSWVLTLPSSSAPTIDCTLGRISYAVEAVVQGLGLFGGDLRQSVAIEVVVNPNGRGSVPSAFRHRAEGHHDETGPWSCLLSADPLASASLLAFDVELPSPPIGFDLKHCKARLEQTISVAHPRQSGRLRLRRSWGISEHRMPGSTVSVLDGNLHDSYVFRELARLPVGGAFQPTSSRGTRSPFRVSHQLVISLLYRQADGSLHDAAVKTRLSIAACCAGLDAAAPPVYAALPSPTMPRRRVKKSSAHADCICQTSRSELAERFIASHFDEVDVFDHQHDCKSTVGPAQAANDSLRSSLSI